MTDLPELLEELAQTPGPPSRLQLDEIYAKGRRRHRRVTGALLTAAAATVVALVGVAVVVPNGDDAPVPPIASTTQAEPSVGQTERSYNGMVAAAAAGDAQHLYAIVLACPPEPPANPWFDCGRNLVGSVDAGKTWQMRSRNIGVFDAMELTALAPDTLMLRATKIVSPGVLPAAGAYVSVDGGRNWKPVEEQSTPTPSVAADGWIETAFAAGGNAVLMVGDPRLARLAPLAKAPALEFGGRALRTATGALWVSGIDISSGRPAVAISNDAGKNWSTHVFTDIPSRESSSYGVATATFDGRVGYAVSMTGAGLDGGGRVWVHRTTDGGQTWQRVDLDGTAPWSYGGGSSFVTPDGAHVIADLGRDGKVSFSISRDGGTRYAPVTFTGMSTSDIGALTFGDPVRPIAGGGYLTFAPADGLYLSSDGLQWRRVVPDAP